MVKGKCSLSAINVTIFMRFFINCVLTVQRKNILESILDTY